MPPRRASTASAGAVTVTKRPAPAQTTGAAPGKMAKQKAAGEVDEVDDSQGAEEEQPWHNTRRVFVGRTLNLHALSPLHVPNEKGSIAGAGGDAGPTGRLDEQTWTALSMELRSYINIRLSDGMSALYASVGPSGGGGAGAGLAGQRDDPLDADGAASGAASKRRRTGGEASGSGHIAAVRMGWVPEIDLVNPSGTGKGKGKGKGKGRRSGFDDEGNQAWAIEIELARPPELAAARNSNSKRPPSKAAARRAQLLQLARLTDLTHLVFLPSASGAERASASSTALEHPVLVSKTSTSAAPDVNRAILTHALNWVQARFDCRVSSAGAAATRPVRALQPVQQNGARAGAEDSVSQRLEELAEIIVRQARAEKEEIDRLTFRGKASRRGINNQEEGHDDSLYAAGPVEMAFALPAEVLDDLAMDGSKVPGPAPELNTITLTVPWAVCMRLLDDTEEGTPLLPALTHYLAQHTSLDLSRTTLSRVGAAGINFGINASACKLKFYDLELSVSSAKLREMQRARVSLVLHHLRSMIEQ